MNKLRLLYGSTVGKKVIMALTGLIWFGYLLVHMAANLQMFAGAETLDAYARSLRELPPLLWGVRLLLVVSIVAHIVTALQLQRIKHAARGTAYHMRKDVQAPRSSRTMIWTGVMIAVFILVHLANLTWGNWHPNFEHGSVYANVVALFQQWFWVVFYGVVMIGVGFHIVHGSWSMFQSLGMNSAQHSPGLRRFARISSLLIVIGLLSIVVAVAARVIG